MTERGTDGGPGGGPRRAFRRRPVSRREAREAVDEELAFHLEEAVRELLEAGMPEHEARRRALEEFGDIDLTRRHGAARLAEKRMAERRTMRLEELMQDVRYAFRTLRKSRGYTAIVVLTLALGIAANTLIFSLMNPYFVRALPFEEPDRLVQIGQIDQIRGWDGIRFSLPQHEDYLARAESFEDLALYRYTWVNVSGRADPERIQVGLLTGNMFDVLGADAARGRTFTPEEAAPDGADVVVLSHGLWRQRFGGDPELLGSDIRLDGRPHTVIGVMPPDFNFPFGGVKMWVPMGEDPAHAERDQQWNHMVGRLEAGVGREAAHRELSGIHAELARRYPDIDGEFTGVSVKPMREALNFAYETLQVAFAVFLAAVAAVLLIACANVASLTLVRASARSREIAVRASVGAGRGRIVRQLLTESTLLALLGAVPGIALAYVGIGLVDTLIPEDLYKVGEVSMDGTVLGFAVAVTLLTPILFGLVPSLRASRTDLVKALKEGDASSGSARDKLRGQRLLVVSQVAMAIVLVSAAGLMLRSFMTLQQKDLGFRSDRILTVEVTPPESDYPDTGAVRQYFERSTAAARAVAGVEAVGMTAPLPLNHESGSVQFAAPDRAPGAAEDWPTAIYARASAGYFEAMGIPVLAGRGFDSGDMADAAPVVVVGRALAERLWPDASAVGRTLLFGDPADPTETTVVGVAGDVQHRDVASPPRPHIYRPLSQTSVRRRFMVLRTAGAPAALTRTVRGALLDVDPNLPTAIRPMSDIVAENTAQWSVGSLLLGAFGAIALLLATLGIYGVIAYSVAQRRRELGVRMALGASRTSIRRLVLGESLRLTGIGLVIGLGLTAATGRVLASLLFGVSPLDPVTLGAVLALFAVVGVGAAAIPALRAQETAVLEVLRYE